MDLIEADGGQAYVPTSRPAPKPLIAMYEYHYRNGKCSYRIPIGDGTWEVKSSAQYHNVFAAMAAAKDAIKIINEADQRRRTKCAKTPTEPCIIIPMARQVGDSASAASSCSGSFLDVP